MLPTLVQHPAGPGDHRDGIGPRRRPARLQHPLRWGSGAKGALQGDYCERNVCWGVSTLFSVIYCFDCQYLVCLS